MTWLEDSCSPYSDSRPAATTQSSGDAANRGPEDMSMLNATMRHGSCSKSSRGFFILYLASMVEEVTFI